MGGLKGTCMIAILVGLSTATLRITDLSHQIDEKVVTWPLNPPYKFSILSRGYYKKTGVWIENNFFALAEHTGTHLDAPAHFGKGSLKMHQLHMKDLSGPGIIINVKAKVAQNPDYGVTIEDVKAYEDKYGRIPYGAVVIMNSGWFYRYPDKEKVFNTKNLNDTGSYHFPGWLANTTQWLIDNREINILGTDAPSFDVGQDIGFPSHIILGKENVVGAESVAYLDKIPESGSTIYMPGLKIFDGSGAPARVFATFDDGIDNDLNGVNNAIQSHPLSYTNFQFLFFVTLALLYS